jgi:18S rRNA (adenine1779-N6/adenine1780-N6)-dimethyltransferase
MVEDNVDMKAKIEQVLLDTGNSENRAAKMDVDDLLKYVVLQIRLAFIDISFRLLSAFHDIGVHFA